MQINAVPAQEGPRATRMQLTPLADREIRKVKDDYARAVSSGQYDEIQLEELWDKTDAYVNRVRGAAAEPAPHPERDTLQQEFQANVLPVDGKLIQKDPQSGRFEVLSEPVKDERQMEEMQFQHTLDTQKGRIDLLKQLLSLQSGNAESGQKPMYTPEQARQEVDRMLPDGQQQGEQSAEDYNARWEQLPVGGTMTWADGKTYRKKG